MSCSHRIPTAGPLLSGLAAAALLAACGGSSSSSDNGIAIDAPEDLTATPGNGEVTVEWSPVDDADSYNVYWAPLATGIDLENPDTGDAGWQPAATSPHTVDELENRQDFAFVVTAVASGQESEPSSEVTARPAPGLAGYSIETSDHTLTAGSYSMVGASCGARLPVGGGLQVMNVASDVRPGVHLQESWPEQINLGGGNIQNIWAVKALNDSGSTREISAYAICIDPPENLDIIDKEITISPGETRSETLTCEEDSGRVILGGGISHQTGSTSPDVRISSSEPAFARTDRWSFRLANDSTVSRTATLYGICSLPPRGYRLGGSGGPIIESGTYDHANTSPCNSPAWLYDENAVVLGGAHRGHDAYSASLQLEQIYPDADGTRWNVGVFNIGASDFPWYRRPVCAIAEP